MSETERGHDPISMFVQRADEVLREMDKSPAVRHLRRAGVELLRAARCTLDDAIDRLEPPRHKQDDGGQDQGGVSREA